MRLVLIIQLRDKDGSTVTLLDIMGQKDDNYDLTEKRMILERICLFSQIEKENYSMHVHRRIKPERNWGTYWIKSNACITLTKNCN